MFIYFSELLMNYALCIMHYELCIAIHELSLKTKSLQFLLPLYAKERESGARPEQYPLL